MVEAITIEFPGLITGSQAKNISEKLLSKRKTRKLIEKLGFPTNSIRIHKTSPDWNKIYKEIEEQHGKGNDPDYLVGRSFLDVVDSYAQLPSLGIITDKNIVLYKEHHKSAYSNPNIDQIVQHSYWILNEESANIDFANREENLKYLKTLEKSNSVILSIEKEDYLFSPWIFVDGMGYKDGFGKLEKYTGQLSEKTNGNSNRVRIEAGTA